MNYWYKTAQDLFSKVYRDKDKLYESVSSQDHERIADAVFNFAVTAYHVKDWLKQEATTLVPEDVEDDVEDYVEDYVKNKKVLSICADLCNGSKHRVLKSPRSTATGIRDSPLKVSMPSISASSSIPVTGFILVIEIAEGNEYDILTWADQVVLAWEDFFTRHPI